MILTPFECYIADDFAKKIVGNIDQRDFMDSRNIQRSKDKLFEDSSKGKKAEIFMYNTLMKNGISCSIDFDIYKKGIGDDGDIIANNKKIDIKASSKNAKCLMIEERRIKIWEDSLNSPQCVCMISVENDKCEYLFGCTYFIFKKKATLLKRGENIPNTKIPLKASNYVLFFNDLDHNIDSFINYIKKNTKNSE